MSKIKQVNLQKSSTDLIHQLVTKVNKSVVFVDNVSMECLHWSGGAMRLFDAGCLEIKELSSFECGSKDQAKAVFMVSGAIVDTAADILRDIITASRFKYVIILSTFNPHLSDAADAECNADAFTNLEQNVLEWMGNLNYSVDAEFVPLVYAPIFSDLFVLPKHSCTFPLLPTDIPLLQQHGLSDNQHSVPGIFEISNFPKELLLELKGLANTLFCFIEHLSLSEDVFSAGQFSGVIANMLVNMLSSQSAKRKPPEDKASLLLIDRMLDLTSAVFRHDESLIDRLMSVLPRLPGHQNDMCVDMSPLCSAISNPDYTTVVPGCLSHSSDTQSSTLLQSIAINKSKECLMEINRLLVEAACCEKLPLNLTGRPGKVTPEQLQSHLNLFKGNYKAIGNNSGLLQIAQAVVEAHRNPGFARGDSLRGLEIGLMQCLGEYTEEGVTGVLDQILQIISKDSCKPLAERIYSVSDIIELLLFLFSIVHDEAFFNTSSEKLLQEAIVNLVFDSDVEALPEFIREIVGDHKTRANISLLVEDLFHKLHGLVHCRDRLQRYKSVLKPGSMTSQATLRPLLTQLVEDIFSPTRPDMVDVECKSTGFKDLLRKGFGLFRSASKPRAGDHPILFIFVVGGITSSEYRQIKEVVTQSKTNVQVIVGSTRLITAADVMHHVFGADNLHPKTLL